MARIDALIDRMLAGELELGSSTGAEALLDLVYDPDDWCPELLAALARLAPLRRPPDRRAGLVQFERPTVIAGDLLVDGDLECLSHTLVLGDLRCTGYVFTGIHDCLCVTGDLAAAALEAQRSYWFIGGATSATTTWLSTYGTAAFTGPVRTRLLVLQMFAELVAPVELHVETRIDTDYLPDDPAARARLAEAIDVDTCLDEDGQLDSCELTRRVARGLPVFRQPASA